MTTATEQRPWGSCQLLDSGPDFRISRLTLRPHERLEARTTMERTEHWVVASGTATCQLGRRRLVIGEGERVDVPRGCRHRLINDSDDSLVVIEVGLG